MIETGTAVMKHELKKAVVFLRPDGIMQIDAKETDEMFLEDFREIVDTIGVIGGGKKYPVLSVAKGYINIDKEARKYSAREEGNRFTLADAFVLQSLALMIIGNFYLKIDKPIRPTRMFSNTDNAVKWLQTFLQHDLL